MNKIFRHVTNNLKKYSFHCENCVKIGNFNFHMPTARFSVYNAQITSKNAANFCFLLLPSLD